MKKYLIPPKLVLLPLIFFVTGCSTSMSLQYEKPSIGEMKNGKLVVVVNDKRPIEDVKNDPYRVGTIRNSFGMPFALRASEGREPTKVIKELVSDCLNAAGYTVVEQSGNTPNLFVELNSFWSDGYQHNRMWLSIITVLKSDSHAEPVWNNAIESNVGVTWSAGYGPFDRGFTRLIEDAKQQLIVSFKGSDFYQSLSLLNRK